MTATRWRELVGWAVVLLVVELLLVSSVDRAELVLAVGLAVPAAALTVLARGSESLQLRVPRGGLRWFVALPAAVVRDSVAVWAAAATGRRGSWRELPRPGTAGDDATAAGRRAWAALVLTTSPGSLCVDVRDGVARLHDLGGSAGSALERAVSR
jgi:hypothetical protein